MGVLVETKVLTLEGAAYEITKRSIVITEEDGATPKLGADGSPVVVEQTVLNFVLPGIRVEVPFDNDRKAEFLRQAAGGVIIAPRAPVIPLRDNGKRKR